MPPPQCAHGISKQIDRLLHWLQILSNLEWCLSLGRDLLNGDTLRNLNQRQTGGVVNIEDTLGNKLATVDQAPYD
jgi:hypothetical protein